MKYLLLLCSLLCGLSAFAQINPNSKQELKSYYERNIGNLDPLEGIYDVEWTTKSRNAYIQFPEDVQSREWCIYKDKTGKFKIYGLNELTIEKIGSSSIYTFKEYFANSNTSTSSRFTLNNQSYFEVSYYIPDIQLRAVLGKQYQAGFAIHYSFSLIKKFPTIEMYSIAKEEDKKKSVSSDWSGTGFALLDGYIATNFHVVDNAKTITIQGVNGDFSTKYSAKVIAVDKINDLAIVKINDDNFTGFGNIPYSIKTTIIDVGEDVFVLGFPLVATMGDEIKLSTGIISSKTGFQGDVSQYQISAPIQPGNSGGPLFNSTGDIVGIVSAKHIGAENVGYAIKSFYLNNLVQSSLPTNILPNKNVILSSSLSGKVKVVEDYIYMIICSSK